MNFFSILLLQQPESIAKFIQWKFQLFTTNSIANYSKYGIQ